MRTPQRTYMNVGSRPRARAILLAVVVVLLLVALVAWLAFG